MLKFKMKHINDYKIWSGERFGESERACGANGYEVSDD